MSERKKPMSPPTFDLDQTATAKLVSGKSEAGYSQRGYSVIDLVIVVALTGIISTFAIQSAAKTLQLHRLDTSTSILTSKLSEARMNAIKRNRQAWLAINPADRTMRLQTTDNSGATVNLEAAETLPEGVDFASPTHAIQIRFDSLGRLPAGTSGWTLTLQGAGNTKSKNVTISVAGKVNVQNMHSSYSLENLNVH